VTAAASEVTREPLISPKLAIALAYVASLLMSAMDMNIVNVMLPTISRDFHSPLTSVEWTATGYVVSLAVAIPASGWLGDRFGNKRVFLVAIAAFTLASVACGLAHSLPQLIAFRVLQGASGGMLTPVATTMLYRAFPPAERPRVMRLMIIPIGIGPITGQPLGGLLTDTLGWHWAFYLNVPFGILTLLVAWRYVQPSPEVVTGRFDLLGFVLSGVGFSAVLLSISQEPAHNWQSPELAAVGVVGVAMLIGFVRHERRTPAPILNLGLLGNRLFRATNTSQIMTTIAFMGGLLYLTPVLLQDVLGRSALESGLTTFLAATGVLTATQTVGRIYPYVGPRRMIFAGMLWLAVMLVIMCVTAGQINPWLLRALLFSAGLGNGVSMIAVQTSMFTTVSAADVSSGSVFFNVARQASAAAGIALFTTITASVAGGHIPAFRAAYAVAAFFALTAALSAFTMISDRDAAATMRARSPKVISTTSAAEGSAVSVSAVAD
jgi:EmrB/QacA subfamily drug resistance transporter